MWSQFVLCLFVGLAYASYTSPAWKDNTEYVYLVTGRTLSSLQEAADQYSGIFLKAKLHLTPRADGKLQGWINDAQYSQVQNHFPNGWHSEIPESQLSYKQLPLTQKPFQIVFENGVIKSLIVEKQLANWEANMIKSIVSQFQLDLQGQNVIRNPINNLPKGDRFDGVFKTMEETISGKTETIYDVHRLPEYLLQSQPWLAPQDKLRGDGMLVEVIKTKNFTHAEDRPSYHFGFGQIKEHEPTANKMGQFFIRESSSRAILTGKLSRYAIQNSYTINKIMVNPIFKNKEMGSVISMVNVTLHEVKNQDQQPQELSDAIDIGNLVYTFETPFSKNNMVHEKIQSSFTDDFSSEESSERSWNRLRRSLSNQMISKSSSQEDSSEEQVQHQPRPQLSRAPESPLLPTMMGYHGKSIKENSDFNVEENVQKLVQEISEDMQEPEKILAESTLNKYTILNTLVRMMNEDEIKSVAEQVYTQNQQGRERLAWVVYRDAVAEAGTGPAFLNIQEWIRSRKIVKDEAADIVATMANAARVPTEEYMRKFFEFIKDSQVNEQEYLNETTILSYTNLVYKVYVNRNQSHNQYPVHAFGNFNTKVGREFVKSTVIPYLSQQLQSAISNGDARKIHVYIRALGNVGHKQILQAFEPYLEGRKQASQFQRVMMIAAMDRLTQCNPMIARSVLYKVYQNTAELPGVRVMAVFQLIRTNPPVEMLQRMAQNTNVDNQEQVNAAVKTVIESISLLKSSKSWPLKEAAESAKPLLTRKNYGTDQSFLEMRDYIIKHMDVEFHHRFLELGSPDSIWPKAVGLSVEGDMHGMKHKYWKVEGMISSIRELINVMYKQTEEFHRTRNYRNQQSDESKWASVNIARLMNYKREEREQLEAVIIGEMEQIQKLWSLDNQTLNQFPELVREQEEILKNGKEFNYAKMKQLKEMALSFPTEMGLPFLYTYDMPVLMRCQGKIKATATPRISRNDKLYKPEQIQTEIDAHVTLSGKAQSHMAFVTPFDHQIYMAGYDRNMQMHLPIKAKVEIDVEHKQMKMEMKFEERHQDARLLHFSTTPYTSRSDIMTIRPVALRPNTYIIKSKQNQHRFFDVLWGKKQTGLAFRAWGHHSTQSINIEELTRIWQTEGILTMWDQVWDKSCIEYTEANVAFVPSESTVRQLTMRYRYDKEYKKQPESQSVEDILSLNQLVTKLQSDEPKQRQQEIMKHVGSGIQSAELYSSDMSFEFDGDQKYQHVFGVVSAKSNADPKSSTLVYYKNKNEDKYFVFEVKAQIPNTNGLDLTYSLGTEPMAKYTVSMQHGQSGNQEAKISGKIELNRSPARKNYLMNEDSLFRVCKEQMQQRNFQLPACQNMTIKANFLDDIKFQLQYQNLNKRFEDVLESIFKASRVYYYPMIEINTVPSEGQNVISGRIQFQPEDLRQVNVTMRTNDEETKIYNISLQDEVIRTILVPHPVFHISSRMGGLLEGWRNFRPTCVIDQTAAQTFSNITYPLSLSNQYTIVLHYIPQDAREEGHEQMTVEEQLKLQSENYVVLVRQVSDGKKELIITFNLPESEGKTVQIDMKPNQGNRFSGSNPAVKVSVDEQQMQFDDKKIVDLYKGYVQIYALPNGEVKMEIRNAFYLIFDGERVKVTATSSKLRDSINGLCGRFSNDKYEDFTVPENCVARDVQKFVNSYQVESSRTRRQQRSGEWQKDCVQKVMPLYADVISDYDSGRSKDLTGKKSTGSKLRTQYIEDNGELCFTIRPVPVCNGSPRETVTKNVAVHCVEATKTAYYLKNQINLGGNPDFSHKSESRTVPMEVAMSCN